MSIKCTCPHCGASMRVIDSYAGSQRPCGKCGTEFAIPAQGASSNETVSNSAVDATETADPSWEADLLNHAVEHLLTQSTATTSWRRDAIILVVSLALSVAAGLFFVSFQTVLLVLGIILFHELGHFAAMRFFDYQNVRIFFIPFLGAATAGRRTNIAGYKEAIVLLMGPAPGILLGVASVAAYLQTGQMVWFNAAWLLIAINAFNLLPLLPLDGGQLMLLTVFSRGRNLEAAFRYGTAAALAIVAWWLSWWLLLGLAALMLLAVPSELTVSRIASRLRRNRDLKPALHTGELSPEAAVLLTQHVMTSVDHDHSPQLVAQFARRVWERLQIHPPGRLATAIVLAAHLALFATSPFAVLSLYK